MSPEEFGSHIPGDITVWKVLFGLVAFWVVLEIGFILVIQFAVLPSAQKLNKTQPYHGDMMKMMKRAVDLVKKLHCYDFRTYLSGFCCGAKYEDIHLENFRSFLVWAMYNKHMPDATEEELAQMEVILKYAQDEHPELKDMPEGYNPNVQHCRMTLDPIPIIHRPLLMYVLIMLKEAFTHVFYLPAHGFQRHEINGQTYWYKKQSNQACCNSNEESKAEGSRGHEPMLFLHGISTGWGGYVNLACAMGSGRDIFLLDLDCVKLNSLQFNMPTPQKFAENIVRILDRHHVDRVSLVGHSFGSMTAGWFLRAHPERISHLTLIDPVSMLLSFPEVAFSFLYRQPSTLMEWIIHVFAAREITVSYTLRRNFWWYNNDLWLEEVPEHIGVVVGVATNDEITNPKAIHEYVNLCRRERLAKRERLTAPGTASERTVSTSGSFTSGDGDGDGETTSSEKSGSDSTDGAEARGGSSLESLLATADSFTCLDGLGLGGASSTDGDCDGNCATTEAVTAVTVAARCNDCGAVAMIECLVWDNYSHGQILAHSPEHHALVATVRSNEKLGVGAI